MPQVKRWSGLLILTFGIYALWESVSYLPVPDWIKAAIGLIK